MNAEFAKIGANLITQSGLKMAKKYKCSVAELLVKPSEVCVLASLVISKIISPNRAQKLFVEMVEERKSKCRKAQTV